MAAYSAEERLEIERLFDEAMSLERDQRETFVRENASSPVVADELLGLVCVDEPATIEMRRHPGSSGSSEPDTTPASLGEYDIEELLGIGGMGVVMLARHREVGHPVAIKIISAHHELHPSRRDRFLREARLLVDLNHPNIARFLHWGQDGDRPYLVMEYVEGRTVADVLGASGPLEPREALRVCGLVARALGYAHEQERPVVHRDIKPGNIMIQPGGEVKVLDFGIACALEGVRTDEALTPAGLSPGTPQYMSPEQARAAIVDVRTDIFALGCLLYECVTGSRLFPKGTYERAEADLSALEARAPQELIDLVRGCVAWEPSDRLQTMGEVVARIESPNRIDPAPDDLVVAPPHAWKSSFGRDEAATEIATFLEGASPVILIGVGGVGKTHLALRLWSELRDRFPSRAFVRLGEVKIDTPEAVAQTVSAALRIREGGGQAVAEHLFHELGERSLLLILDECEAVSSGVSGFVTELLSHCPGLRVLATSRERLPIDGARLCEVPSLPAPSDERPSTPEALGLVPSVQLFVDRAQLVLSGFGLTSWNATVVAEICRVLDGIPLAVEVAAAWVDVLEPSEILEELRAGGLPDAGTESPDRQSQTIEAAIGTSYQRLSENQRLLFRRLAVFRGGWTNEPVRRICCDTDGGADASAPGIAPSMVRGLLSELRRKSMLVTDSRGPGLRHRFLEPVRAFAERQEAGSSEVARLRERHARYFADKARELEARRSEPGASERLAALSREHENLRHALVAACEDGMLGPEAAARFVADLWSFWFNSGHFLTEWRDFTLAALRLDPDACTEARALATNTLGICYATLGETDEARRWYEAGRALWERLERPDRVVGVLNNIGSLELNARGFDAAEEAYSAAKSLLLSQGDRETQTFYELCNNMGVLYLEMGRFDEAASHFEETLAYCRLHGIETWRTMVLQNLGEVAYHTNQHRSCCARLEEAYRLTRTAPPSFVAVMASLLYLGLLADRCEGADEAALAFGLVLQIGRAADVQLPTSYAEPLETARARVVQVAHHEDRRSVDELLADADVVVARIVDRCGGVSST